MNFAFEFVFSFSLFIPPNDMLKWAFESKLFAMILKFLFFFALNVLRCVARAPADVVNWRMVMMFGRTFVLLFRLCASQPAPFLSAPHTTILYIDIQMGF